MSIRTTNPEIPRYWANGVAARSGNGQFSTDGQSLFSYNKEIGITTVQGKKVLFDFTAPAGHKVSVTTSTHVGRAKRWCDVCMNPALQNSTEALKWADVPF